MLNSTLISVAAGIVLGFLSGTGAGGGSLLILWLTMVMEMPAETAKQVNLLFFLPCAAISCYFRKKQGLIQYRQVLPAIVAGCIGALAGTAAGMILPHKTLKTLFGILFISTGIRELLYKPKNQAS